MPTRLEVLLQRRKSAAAGLFHRHRNANASTGIKPAVMRTENGLRRWESFGIIQCSYIKSLMVSRRPPGTANGQAVILRQGAAESRPLSLCLRCDMAKSVTTPI